MIRSIYSWSQNSTLNESLVAHALFAPGQPRDRIATSAIHPVAWFSPSGFEHPRPFSSLFKNTQNTLQTRSKHTPNTNQTQSKTHQNPRKNTNKTRKTQIKKFPAENHHFRPARVPVIRQASVLFYSRPRYLLASWVCTAPSLAGKKGLRAFGVRLLSPLMALRESTFHKRKYLIQRL